jgi:hypothetical protein
MNNKDAIRAAFEAWCTEHGFTIRKRQVPPFGKYVGDTGALWKLWQAAYSAKPDIERLERNGQGLFDFATKQGWKDDGEGALEFVTRKCIEFGRNENKLSALVEILDDGEAPQVGDMVSNLGMKAWRIFRIDDKRWYSVDERSDEVFGYLSEAQIIRRNNRPVVYRKELEGKA